MKEKVISKIILTTACAMLLAITIWLTLSSINENHNIFITYNNKTDTRTKENHINLNKSNYTTKTTSANDPKPDHLLSVEEKILAEDKQRKRSFKGQQILSSETLLSELENKGASISDELRSRLVSGNFSMKDVDMLQLHIASVLTEEESFYVELSQYHNFDEIHEAFNRREATTGLFYGNKMLAETATYKGAGVEQIKGIIDKGTTLPPDTIKHLIRADNLDLAEDLVESGYNINPDFQDEFYSMNGVELLAQDYTYNPLESDPKKKADEIRRLADLGVSLDVSDGTRDVLDITLEAAGKNNYEPSARRLAELADRLIKMGVKLDASHYQLMEKLKQKHPTIYQEFITQ